MQLTESWNSCWQCNYEVLDAWKIALGDSVSSPSVIVFFLLGGGRCGWIIFLVNDGKEYEIFIYMLSYSYLNKICLYQFSIFFSPAPQSNSGRKFVNITKILVHLHSWTLMVNIVVRLLIYFFRLTFTSGVAVILTGSTDLAAFLRAAGCFLFTTRKFVRCYLSLCRYIDIYCIFSASTVFRWT